VGLAVFADPLAMGMLVEEFGAKARVFIVDVLELSHADWFRTSPKVTLVGNQAQPCRDR